MAEVAGEKQATVGEHDARNEAVGHADGATLGLQPHPHLGGAVRGPYIEGQRRQGLQETRRQGPLPLAAGTGLKLEATA
jgi:hypothetical protein